MSVAIVTRYKLRVLGIRFEIYLIVRQIFEIPQLNKIQYALKEALSVRACQGRIDCQPVISCMAAFQSTYVYACKSVNPSIFHFINKIHLETHTTSQGFHN